MIDYSFDVDLVLPWVDGSDPAWVKQKNKHSGQNLTKEQIDYQTKQFRDWDNLQYLFRGIERFMPWIRTVHFITCGHTPTWLNKKHPQLNWVQHTDYIPKEYLPTFSSHTIELNIHRIEGLSDHFIYFNDDMFVLQQTHKSDFFAPNGLPKDQSVLFRIPGASYNDIFGHIQLNDIGVINQNFDRADVLKRHWRKLFSPKNGLLAPVLSATFLPTNHFPGFMVNHMLQAYRKSTFAAVWFKEPDILDATCRNKFRTINDVNQYVMREWQFVTGAYQPTNLTKRTKYFSIFPEQLDALTQAITHQQYQSICINDAKVEDFQATKRHIIKAFDQVLPHKSGFEL